MNAQNTDTMKRLNTLIQTKKARPTQMFWASVENFRRTKKISRLSMKKR